MAMKSNLPLLPINGRPGEQVLKEIQPGYRPNPEKGVPPADAVPKPPPAGTEPNPMANPSGPTPTTVVPSPAGDSK